jgi:hypothetical protein
VTVADQRELVAALLSVDGVADAAIEQTAGETEPGPGSLRLLLRPGADEVGVATAVNKVLRDRFGLAVDSDRVAVVEEQAADSAAEPGRKGARPTKAAAAKARIGVERVGRAAEIVAPVVAAPAGPTGANPQAPRASGGVESVEVATAEPPRGLEPEAELGRGPRMTIERVQVVTAGLSVTSTVTLAVGDQVEVGEVEGVASASGVHRTVANATLLAVAALVGEVARFELEHVEISSAASEPTALALVTMLTDRGGERLSGSSVVRDDQRQAVIRAVLAAVNRRVEPLLTPA